MALRIEEIEVRTDRVEARVRVTDPALARTSAVPGLVQRAVELLPGLVRHTCENDAGQDFRREMANTETPHLLEHVAAELMALSGSPRSLRADTSWDFARDGKGVFRVSLAFDDDLVAVGALKEGVTLVEYLLVTPEGARRLERPDVDAAVARLRSVRARGSLSE